MGTPVKAVVGVLIVAGCAEGEPPAAAPEAARVWTAHEEVRIGAADGGPIALTHVGRVLIGPEDDLYVSQPLEGTIRRFGPDGDYRGSIGRPGGGPGEFGFVMEIGLLGDSLFVSDHGRGGVHLFDLDGGYLTFRALRSQPVSADPLYFTASAPAVLLADGSALVSPAGEEPMATIEPGVFEGTSRWPYLRVYPDSARMDTVLWASTHPLSLAFGPTDRLTHVFDPFDDEPLYTLLPDGRGVAVVERSAAEDTRTSTFTLTIIGPARDTVLRSAIPYGPITMNEDAVRRAVRQASITTPGEATDYGAVEAAVKSAGMVPSTLPPVSAFAATQDGRIWLRREETDADSVAWTVIGEDRRVAGEIRLPAGVKVAASRGDIVVGIEHDRLDVPYVVKYRISDGVDSSRR